jgi:hypothetical protein
MRRASFTTEQYSEQNVVLLVCEEKNEFVNELKAYLIRHDMQVHVSAVAQTSTTSYQFTFVVGSQTFIEKNTNHKGTLVCVCFVQSRKDIVRTHFPNASHIIFVLGTPQYAVQQLENIVWFVLEKSRHTSPLIFESAEQPNSFYKKASHHTRPLPSFRFPPIPIRLRVFIGIVFLIVVLFSFYIPLGIATWYSYQSLSAVSRFDFKAAKQKNDMKAPLLRVASLLYMPIRPLYLLFSLAQFPEDIFFVNETATKLSLSSESLIEKSKHFSQLLFQRQRNQQLATQTRKAYDAIDAALADLEQSSTALYRKIPPLFLSSAQKKDTEKKIGQLKKTRRLFAYLPLLLGEHKSQKILLLFANNMELRPGGGFIGSFGILNLNHFGIEDLQIYDVYDADGQLTAHIDPPNPIRAYLAQPHWFLRDSAFFPDFRQTYNQATVFLNKELGAAEWDGGVMITTSAVKDIIGSFGKVYMPDYKEYITRDNFYIKTQYHAENNFFPGSSQKKSFLSDLVKQLFTEMEQANALALGSAVIQSLDQKFIVAQSENPEIQQTLDNLYWTGRVATPFCPPGTQSNCFSDYQLVLDSNMGVNKVNTFIDRAYKTATEIDENGLTTTTLTLTYMNRALTDVYPGGTYVNYVQFYLPQDARILYVARDRVRLETYDSQTENQKVVGFLMNLPPQQTTSIEVQYTSSLLFKKGRAIYQLVVQKQIGAFSNDLAFSLTIPSNMHLGNTNFSPLVKNSQIIYNTDLSTDRVFFIELSKE